MQIQTRLNKRWNNFKKNEIKKDCKIYHRNRSENRPITNYCWGLILKAMKNNCDENNESTAVN